MPNAQMSAARVTKQNTLGELVYGVCTRFWWALIGAGLASVIAQLIERGNAVALDIALNGGLPQ